VCVCGVGDVCVCVVWMCVCVCVSENFNNEATGPDLGCCTRGKKTFGDVYYVITGCRAGWLEQRFSICHFSFLNNFHE